MENIRVFLILSLLTVVFLFFQAWEKDNAELKILESTTTQENILDNNEYIINEKNNPQKTLEEKNIKHIQNSIVDDQNIKNLELIEIKTKLFNLKINPKGGDLVFLEMNNYLDDDKKNKYILFNDKKNKYVMQTGLISESGPDSHKLGRAIYYSEKQLYDFKNQKKDLFVDLKYNNNDIDVIKRFIFKNNSYEIGIKHIFKNKSEKILDTNIYARIRKQYTKKEEGFFPGTSTYNGVVVSNENDSFKKISFSEIKKGKYKSENKEGWISIIENYFLSVLIPKNNDINYVYSTETFQNGEIGIRFVSSEYISIPKNSQYVYDISLYAGPILPNILKDVAPKLELTADYGMLWLICMPIFYLLKYIYTYVGNWGFSIILVTLIIKLAFYWLNAKNYRSMGNLRKLEPRIKKLKESYGDDKQKFGQALMELYKKEKVNPLGGCLPILIQLPVFIALYWVLLGSVELRHAPFILWINDLSAKDPYFILPLIMGITMFLQQSLSPKPADPIQAKVMKFIPLIFTVLFLNFPSGLVLYWVVSNILSILQQWSIMRNISK
jgi:YidC/Oxa1 family membrane protein insertase